MPHTSPEARYDRLVVEFASETDVDPPSAGLAGGRGFGANALKVDGRIFAMLTRDRLVVKLPRVRVDELVLEGVGERFDPGHGRIMKEWLSIHDGHEEEWEALAREALTFGRRPK